MPKSRLEDIYDCLKTAGIDVYFPGQHKGDCRSNYVVVKPGAVTKYMQFSTNVAYYELLCYSPADHPSETDKFKDQVKTSMLTIHPKVRYANMETAPYFDDSVKGWMVDITYQNYRKYDSKIYQQLDQAVND